MSTQASEILIGEGPVLLSLDGSIARLRLNRPQQSNGISIALLEALHQAVMRCHGDPRIRVVLLSGEGPNFCAGGDVKEFAAKGEGLPDFLRQATSYLQISASALIHLEAPVVTAVQGYAAGGGGLGLVCASDLVIAARSAKFMAGATRVGMAPDAGASVALPRLIGFRRAMDMILTNRVMDAAEALDVGLVTRVVADDALEAAALDVARELAAGAPKALAASKRLLWSGLGLGIDACLPEEARTVSELSGTADAREGLAAVIGRRAPRFTGR
ncbi:enoyl-CoA hydratase/isomerase family protein [Rhodoligotrophos defluvii]|uniref:enoyl-CoA hydratase/isomerase family protein n=1 Tax=Rhodoligotrophos defluvii TaxID=2561934 RepID=UPI001EEFD40E|nr:enoyl-CoA hydratase-related protein [Rhodoligotrophos defluvii]